MSRIDTSQPTLGPQKATIAAVIGGILAFLTPIQVAVTNDIPVDGEIWLNSTIAALVFAGGLFGAVYQTTNKPK